MPPSRLRRQRGLRRRLRRCLLQEVAPAALRNLLVEDAFLSMLALYSDRATGSVCQRVTFVVNLDFFLHRNLYLYTVVAIGPKGSSLGLVCVLKPDILTVIPLNESKIQGLQARMAPAMSEVRVAGQTALITW